MKLVPITTGIKSIWCKMLILNEWTNCDFEHRFRERTLSTRRHTLLCSDFRLDITDSENNNMITCKYFDLNLEYFPICFVNKFKIII